MAAAIPVVVAHNSTHLPSPLPDAHLKPRSTANPRRVALNAALKLLSTQPTATTTHGTDFYNSLISLCISEKALAEGTRLRAHLSATGWDPGVFLNNQFLNLYAKCGEMGLARETFDEMHHRNTVSWNAMISGYCSAGLFLNAICLFTSMVDVGVVATKPTYLSVLQSCVGLGDADIGNQVHACVVKAGLVAEKEVSNSLISVYSRLGSIADAELIFEKMAERDVVSWNSIINVNSQKGRVDLMMTLYVEMLKRGLRPDEFTFGSLFGSKDVLCVRELHCQAVKCGLGSHIFVASALVEAYAKCGCPQEAYLVFGTMPERNIVAWNSVVALCLENDMVSEGINLFLKMGKVGLFPDIYTISSLLRAATTELSVAEGVQFHGFAVKLGLCSNGLVGNSIINMYSKHEMVSDSIHAFNSISDLDIVSWNSIIQSHVYNEKYEDALLLFDGMKLSGMGPDEFSFIGALTSCASLGVENTGRQVHADLIKSGIAVDNFLGSALVDMYSEFTAVADAIGAFCEIEFKDMIAWNSIIVGLAKIRQLDRAIQFLHMMREEHLEPDKFTFAALLAGCADVAALQRGRQLHSLLLKSEFVMDAAVANSLIMMYMRCGNTKEAELVFSTLTSKNIVSWTTLIGGYGQTGYFRKALDLFEQLERSGVRPNAQTLLALLTACSYSGMTNIAEKYFLSMEGKYGIQPEFEHYACMVDIYARAGRLSEAEYLINNMPYKANALVWRMLLSACRIHGDIDRGKKSMMEIINLEPGDSAAYVLMSNLYASLGQWTEAIGIRNMMKENGVSKEPGKSWIEIKDKVHEFSAYDQSHSQTNEIYFKLRELTNEMMNETTVQNFLHSHDMFSVVCIG